MEPRRFRTKGELQAFLQSRPAGVLHITVEHDDWCAISALASCDCEPTFLIEKATAERLSEGAKAETEWLASRRS